MTACPCGSGDTDANCCLKYISGNEWPKTAAQLMRSRYTAFTLANVDYLNNTQDPETRSDQNPEDLKDWAKSVTWLGLEVLRTSRGKAEDQKGVVEFIARFKDDQGPQQIHEVSQFRRIAGRWMYSTGSHHDE